MITYPPGTVRRGHHIFPECVSEHALGGWLPTKGELHKLLRAGEFDLIGDAPIFEGTFVQVTKRGEFVGILNHPNIVILGVLASTPTMLLPDLIIIARDKKEGKSKTRKLEIARLIPLELVEIYVHNIKERRLKIHMVTGRNYYLQLCAPDGEEGFQFERWMHLIYLLHLATDKAKAPSHAASKDIGLHTIWKTASLPSETQYWLPVIMDKGSSEELKKWSSHARSTRMEQKSKQSAVSSKQSPSKSGAAVSLSPQQPSGIIPTEARTEKSFSSRRPSARSPPPPHASVAVGTSELATVSVGIGPSKPFTLSEAIGPSQPGSQLGAWTSSQRKSTEQPGTLAAYESILSKDSIPTERESWASGEAPIKLERSKKSRSLVQSATSQLAQQKSSKSRSNALDLEKSATETRATSQSSRSARPLTQGEAGGLTSQSSSRKQSQPASRDASMRAPSATVARSHMSAAVGSSDAYNKSVAIGPSEVGAVSVAAGPSKLASQAFQVASAKSKASQASAFTAPQPTSHESRATPARNKASGDAGARILEDVKEEGEEAAGPGDRPISREMPVKSKPSEKEGSSAAPSGLPSQGRTNAPYSQMAGMNKEPEGAVGTRPVSREMSVKSKPSEKQGASAAASELPRQGRTSSPSSQMAGKPLTSARPSCSPKPGYTSPSPAGRTSKGGSHLYRTLVSVAAGRSEPAVKSVAVGPSQPFLGGRSRPQSRTLEADKSVKVRTIFSRKKSKSGDKTQPSSTTEKQEPPRNQTSKSKSRLKNTLSSAKQRSSLTFVTIYSVLSSSMERLRHSKSNEEVERKPLLEDQLETATARPSKHVTISGVIGPSGKSVQTEEEPLVSSEMNTLSANEICSTTATLGSEPGNLTAPQSHTVTSEASVVTSNMESSASPQLGGTASNPILPSSRPSEKSALDEEAPTRTEVASLPPQSKISVDRDISTAGTKPAGAVSATSANREEQGQPSVQSQQQSKMEDGLKPSSQPSAVTRPPDQSRISVGVGRSVVENKSAAVGPSVRSSLRDEAVGPSITGSWKQQGKSSVQSRQQSKTEDGRRPISQLFAETGPPDRSRISVGVGRSVLETKSAAVGPSIVGSWKEQRERSMQSHQQSQMVEDWKPSSHPSTGPRPPDRSHMSVGVGRSIIDTKSVGVGRSQRERVSEGAGPSKPGSMFIARNLREPSTRLQGNSVLQPQGWLGTVETEDKPVFKAKSSQIPRTTAASPGPSGGASRVVTPSGGVGSRVTKDALARSYN